MLIFQAGLQAVPAELYDAAVVDGAGPLQTWWLITIPSLRPTFIFLFITGTIDAMSRFSDLWTLGGPAGTPARSLQTIVLYMYQTAFESNDFNLASASGSHFVCRCAHSYHGQFPLISAAGVFQPIRSITMASHLRILSRRVL